MKNIAIIDIGSNSIRLVLVNIFENGTFKIIDEIKESVRLGYNMIGNILAKDRIDAAIETLKTFKRLCDAVQAKEIIAVATEAVRKAVNQNDFLELAKNEADISIRVLTGNEEAYYDYLGSINSMDISDGLLIDIGGSSTELVWIEDRKFKESISLPLGAIALTQKFNLKDKISEKQEVELKIYLIDTFNKIPWIKNIEDIPLIGVGGTIRNIGKINRKRKKYPLDISHNYTMKYTDVNKIYSMVKNKTLEQRKKIKGLSKDRADIFVGACFEVYTLIQLCNIKKISISGCGVREGLIYEYISTNHTIINNVLDYSLKCIMTNLNINTNHANHVYKLTKSLFNGLTEIHNINIDVNKIISTGALLHDSGISITYYNHHKHSFYIILNSRIRGLSHKELLMSAYTAAYHRKDDYPIASSTYADILNLKNIQTIKYIGILLKIAESLDKSLTGIVEDVECVIENDSVTITALTKRNIDLEINDALKSSNYFEKVYGKKLLIEEKLKDSI